MLIKREGAESALEPGQAGQARILQEHGAAGVAGEQTFTSTGDATITARLLSDSYVFHCGKAPSGRTCCSSCPSRSAWRWGCSPATLRLE